MRFESFEEMATAIIAVANADPDFPGIVPWDNPAELLIGYIKAAPKSKRTHLDQWCCPIQSIKGISKLPKALKMKNQLNVLVKKGRLS